MVNYLNKYVNEDFYEFITYLTSNYLIFNSISNDIKGLLKKIHQRVYTIAIWSKKFSRYPENKKHFINEIRSDAIQSIPLVLMGYKKSTSLSLRNWLENITKHIFFFDHPIEFKRYLYENNYSISKKDLFEYLKYHPSINKAVKEDNIINKFNVNYSNLSKIIHGSIILKPKTISCLKNIAFSFDYFKEYNNKIIFLCKYTNFLFGLFHAKSFLGFDNQSRSFILRMLDPSRKRIFHKYISSNI